MKRKLILMFLAAGILAVAGSCKKEMNTGNEGGDGNGNGNGNGNGEVTYECELGFKDAPEGNVYEVKPGVEMQIAITVSDMETVSVSEVPEKWTAVISADTTSVAVTPDAAATEGNHVLKLAGKGKDGKDYEASCTLVINSLGYADPAGVFIVNEGPGIEAGSITYIAPDGTVTDDLYRTVNGSELGDNAQDMYYYNGKFYILCWNAFSDTSDGRLIIVDAKTFRKEKAFNDELAELNNPSNIVVLDENNVFIRDESAMYRFDTATSRLVAIEGTWRQAFDDGGKAGRIGAQGMAVVDGKLYASAGGWTMATDDARFGLYEFEKGMDKVARTLSISNRSRISGVCKGEDGHVWVSTTIYSDEIAGTVTGKNEIFKVNCANMEIVDQQEVRKGNLDDGLFRTSAITADGNNIYFTGNTTVIYRHSFETGRTEILVDASTFDENAKVMYNHPVVDPITHTLYMNTLKDKWEYGTNNILAIDVAGETAVLKSNYKNHTEYPAGIICMSSF